MSDSSKAVNVNSASVDSPLHVIRLRGPWECRALDSSMQETPATLVVPGDWTPVLGSDFQGVARFARRFGRPTGLEANERVMLVVESVAPRGSIWLQGEKIAEIDGRDQRLRTDITARLSPTNQLWIDVPSMVVGEPGRVGEVRLEIVGPNSLTT